jgi:hypothetical protein
MDNFLKICFALVIVWLVYCFYRSSMSTPSYAAAPAQARIAKRDREFFDWSGSGSGSSSSGSQIQQPSSAQAQAQMPVQAQMQAQPKEPESIPTVTLPVYEPGKKKNIVKPEELIPKDEHSTWNEVNPGNIGLMAQNFLTAGHHIAKDTIGSSRKNANLQLRPDIPNPRIEGLPWNNSTIEADCNISKPFM